MDGDLIQTLWRTRSDEAVAEALNDLDTYDDITRQSILEESYKRGIQAVHAANISSAETLNSTVEQPSLGVPNYVVPGPSSDEYQVVDSSGAQRPLPLFLYIPISRLILLSLFSWGTYQNYWIYKNWQYIAERDQEDITPFWRGAFGLFWFGSLVERMYQDRTARHYIIPTFIGTLVAPWAILVVIGNILSRSGEFWYAVPVLVLLQVACLIPIQRYVNDVTRKRDLHARYHRWWSPGHIVCVLLGLLHWTIVVATVISPIQTMNSGGETTSTQTPFSSSDLFGNQKEQHAEAEMKALHEKIAARRQELDQRYAEEVNALGLDEVLTPEFSEKDAAQGMKESLRRCTKALEAAHRYHEDSSKAFGEVRGQVEALQIDESIKAQTLEQFDLKVKETAQQQNELFRLDNETMQKSLDLVIFLRDHRKHWVVKDGKYIMDDDNTLQKFNELEKERSSIRERLLATQQNLLKDISDADKTFGGN
jgi:hypothetical protein